MTITVEIPEEVEKKVQQSVAQGDIEAARHLLLDAVIPSVEAHFIADEEPKDISIEEFEALAKKLADLAEEYIDPDCPLLSDYAVSREGIYEGRPKL